MLTSASVSEAEKRWLRVLGTLNEYQARLFVAERALALGRGGISRLAKLTGMSRPTIANGAAELQGPALLRAATDRIRAAGDPMSLLKWTSKSTRLIAAELTRLGHPIAGPTVARCLDDMGYSLQANAKMIEGRQHPDRDAQFRSINARVKAFLRTGNPVVSVDSRSTSTSRPESGSR